MIYKKKGIFGIVENHHDFPKLQTTSPQQVETGSCQWQLSWWHQILLKCFDDSAWFLYYKRDQKSSYLFGDKNAGYLMKTVSCIQFFQRKALDHVKP